MAKRKSKTKSAPATNGSARVRVDDADFVRAWKTAADSDGTHKSVADSLGLHTQSVYQRANRLRSKGLALPKLQRGKRQIDVEGLQAILDS